MKITILTFSLQSAPTVRGGAMEAFFNFNTVKTDSYGKRYLF